MPRKLCALIDIISLAQIEQDKLKEVLKGLVSTSKWPRNEVKFLACPRKARIESLALELEIGQNSEEFFVLSSIRPRKREKSLGSSRPRKYNI